MMLNDIRFATTFELSIDNTVHSSLRCMLKKFIEKFSKNQLRKIQHVRTKKKFKSNR